MSKTDKILEIMLDAVKEIPEQNSEFDISQCNVG
jgi:hypothetical protein